MQLRKVAWRPFRAYRQEESGTRIHLIDLDASSQKCLCGKAHDLSPGAWGESAFAVKHCKRCLAIIRKRGVGEDEIRNAPYLKAIDRG